MKQHCFCGECRVCKQRVRRRSRRHCKVCSRPLAIGLTTRCMPCRIALARVGYVEHHGYNRRPPTKERERLIEEYARRAADNKPLFTPPGEEG